MGIDVSRLGPAAQAQIRAELERRQRQQQALDMRRRAQRADNLGSDLERRYYEAYIWPDLLAGKVASCETQCRFDLLPPAEYCGIRLPAAHYTADFVVTYTTGTVKVVEVKSAFVRKAQRDYIYRRRLFIDLIARPKGWMFEEYIDRER